MRNNLSLIFSIKTLCRCLGNDEVKIKEVKKHSFGVLNYKSKNLVSKRNNICHLYI